MLIGLSTFKNLEPYYSDGHSFLFIGKQGTGKTTILNRLAIEEIKKGTVVFIGDCSTILKRFPVKYKANVHLFDPATTPFALNFFHKRENHSFVAGVFYQAVKSIWFPDMPTANIEQYLRTSIQTLLAVPGSTFLHIIPLLTDSEYRQSVLTHITDPVLLSFWEDFEKDKLKEQRQLTRSTLNKLWSFSLEPLVRDCIGQRTNKMSFKGTTLIHLDNRLGSENISLLGTLILAELYLSGITCTLFVDDAYRFGMLPQILSLPNIRTVLTLRKVKRNEAIVDAVENIVALRTSVADAKYLEPEFLLDDKDHLHTLGQDEAFIPHGTGSVKLTMPNLTAKLTKEEAAIRKGNEKQSTQPRDKVQERIGRFF